MPFRLKSGCFGRPFTLMQFLPISRNLLTLAQIDEFNNKTKSLNRIVYNGWLVRNVYKNSGSAFSISFF